MSEATPVRKNSHFGKDEAIRYIEAVKLVGPVTAFEYLEVSGGTVYNKQKTNPAFSIAVSFAAMYKDVKGVIDENEAAEEYNHLLVNINEVIDELMEKYSDTVAKKEKSRSKSEIEALINERVKEKMSK